MHNEVNRRLHVDIQEVFNGDPREVSAHVDNTLGNILVKHNDKWRGDYYLKEDLTFSVERSQAGRFYILKAGDTTILNGDRVGIHMGSRTLIIDANGILRLIDREQVTRGISTFIITDGCDNTDPITYESSVFFISDKNNNMALKYQWGMNLVSDDSSTYHPRNHPNLINSTYHTDDTNTNGFQFAFERADTPITRAEVARTVPLSSSISHRLSQQNKSVELLDGYKGAIMIVLLMVILILCVLASKY